MKLTDEEKEEIKIQQEDKRIHKYWKFPKRARDIAFWCGFGGLMGGLLLSVGLFEAASENLGFGMYKDFLFENASCEQMEELFDAEKMDHMFRTKLMSKYMVECS